MAHKLFEGKTNRRTMVQEITIEKVSQENFHELIRLIEQLAAYEKQQPPDEKAQRRLKQDCLSEKPRFEAYLAKIDDQYVAYMIFFMTYSSYLALPTLFLEDIFVLEEYRRQGIGQKMFRFCVHEAQKRNCGRMEWTVYNWNKPAIKFYEKNDAQQLNKTYFRLNKNQIEHFDESGH